MKCIAGLVNTAAPLLSAAAIVGKIGLLFIFDAFRVDETSILSCIFIFYATFNLIKLSLFFTHDFMNMHENRSFPSYEISW